MLNEWTGASHGELGRALGWRERLRLCFGAGGSPWDEEKVLDRYEMLYEAGPDGKSLLPWLATSHELSSDQRTWTFHLRPGVKFHNGQPLTGADVVFSLERALGSGVVISVDGYIVTNHHVVDGAEQIKIDLTDGRTLDAKLIGSDAPSDLALLKISGSGLPFLTPGDSDKVRVGDVALAIGNPLGIGQTVTMGIISAKGRSTAGPGAGNFEDFLQTDAPINQGNSGGALINTNGELIGRLMRRFIYTAGITGLLQIGTLIIMTHLAV